MPIFEQPAYIDRPFNDLDASGEHVTGVSFQDCHLTGCNFNEGVFEHCSFEGCTFKACDLSLARFPRTSFKNAHFNDCRLVGVNWCGTDWEAKSLLSPKRVDFVSCLLDHALFIRLDLAETSFKDCLAHGTDFEGANLTRADFRGADLAGARFVGCDLTEANFTNAQGYAINAADNTLHKTKFSLPEAVALLHSLDIILEDESED